MDRCLAHAAFCCDVGILYVFTVVYYRYMLRPSQRRRNLKFENIVFIQNKNNMFSVCTTPQKFKNKTISGDFGFHFEKNVGRKIT